MVPGEISDEMDASTLVAESYGWDKDTKLSLLEINLRQYTRQPLSEEALANTRSLFGTLRKEKKRYVVRFLYDLEGKNMENEPTRRCLIETHMRQLGDIVNENKDIIYTLQGLFIGNWGEMNGTRYTDMESLRALSRTLASVTDDDVFLSVRVPMQWRQCTGTERVIPGTLTARLGLFNDGMMGNEYDLGSYAVGRRDDVGIIGKWCRQDELEFQDKLCRYVPNGGEVVYDTEYNDFEAAVVTLAKMHVSYLNLDYDRSVINKWKASKVRDGSVWDGTDGLTYMDRHLGCRFVADKARIDYAFFPNELTVTVPLRNVGFSPLYREVRAEAVFVGTDGTFVLPLDGNLQTICSGEGTELVGKLSLSALKRGDYDVFLRLTDREGKAVAVAVEEASSPEVPIGRIRAK